LHTAELNNDLEIIFFAEHVKTANNYSLASEADLGYVKQLRMRKTKLKASFALLHRCSIASSLDVDYLKIFK